MRKLIALTLILCSLFAIGTSAQKRKKAPIKKKPFTCQLTVNSTDSSNAVIMWKAGDMSCFIPVNFKNGVFSYTLKTSPLLKVSKNDIFQISHGGKYTFFVLDTPKVTIYLDSQEIKGSPTNELLSSTMKQIRTASSKAEANKIALQAILDNKENAVSKVVLNTKLKDFSSQELQEIIDQGGNYLNHPICNKIFTQVKRAPGQKMKDLELNDTQGNAHKLSEYIRKGQYTLFDFWASWCRPCLEEMPYVKHNYKKFKDQGFLVVGISLDKDAEAWKKGIQQNQFDWIQLSDLKGWNTIVHEPYGIVSIPANILCDGDGNIIATDLRGNELNKKLDELYGEAN